MNQEEIDSEMKQLHRNGLTQDVAEAVLEVAFLGRALRIREENRDIHWDVEKAYATCERLKAQMADAVHIAKELCTAKGYDYAECIKLAINFFGAVHNAGPKDGGPGHTFACTR